MPDPQEIWDDYYTRIKARRIAEAAALWKLIEEADLTGDALFVLDFVHFSENRAGAATLASQLSENYPIEVVPSAKEGYWEINGTTRPAELCLSKEQHLDWVEFMVDVARSHRCVFSSWTLESPSTPRTFESASLDVE